TAKAWRQKGTGRARVGTLGVSSRFGGGVTFGPKPRHYTVKVNRKARRKALRSAFAVHAERDSVALLDVSIFDTPSTTTAAARIAEVQYTCRVDYRAHKTQVAQAVEEVFGVNVAAVRTSKVRAKPKRRGLTKGRSRAWKKAIVQLAPGERIELFEGAETA